MWGSPPLEIPEAATIKWGARAIHEPRGCGFSLLPDRQALFGGPAATALTQWVNKQLPRFRNRAKGMSSDSDKVDEFHEAPFHFKMTSNSSYGYMYMVAWMDPPDEKPEDGK